MKMWKTGLCSSLLICAAAAGCAVDADAPANGAAESLDTLVVPSADFTFATSRGVRVEIAPEGETNEAVAVEIADTEGRRLVKGAFIGRTAVDVKLPLGAGQQLRVRTGNGDQAKTQVVDIADGRAVVRF